MITGTSIYALNPKGKIYKTVVYGFNCNDLIRIKQIAKNPYWRKQLMVKD